MESENVEKIDTNTDIYVPMYPSPASWRNMESWGAIAIRSSVDYVLYRTLWGIAAVVFANIGM